MALCRTSENVSLVNAVVIVDKNPSYLPPYASSDEREVIYKVHVGVISRDSVAGQLESEESRISRWPTPKRPPLPQLAFVSMSADAAVWLVWEEGFVLQRFASLLNRSGMFATGHCAIQ